MLVIEGKKDADCKLLTTVPRVGIITAMTYKATLDDARRFEESSAVGAYMGLTPRQYASGENKAQAYLTFRKPDAVALHVRF
ncbi:transposase [Candidatus Tisiphia endosymbiont of Ditula angustiorana]|uniref:transposase n=1 Tax=Candidatus Tisiphia endosymbiont of Ditula angustiorana TaxID=3066272 RepID=UPI00312C898E